MSFQILHLCCLQAWRTITTHTEQSRKLPYPSQGRKKDHLLIPRCLTLRKLRSRTHRKWSIKGRPQGQLSLSRYPIGFSSFCWHTVCCTGSKKKNHLEKVIYSHGASHKTVQHLLVSLKGKVFKLQHLHTFKDQIQVLPVTLPCMF